MIFVLLLFFSDLFVSLKVGITIGFGWSVLWIVGSMLAGGVLLRLSPYALMGNIQQFGTGRFSINDTHNASFSYMFGAIFLIIPGVLTDLAGLVLLLYTLYLHLFATMRPKQSGHQQMEGEENVIDVEIVDEYHSCDSDTAGR